MSTTKEKERGVCVSVRGGGSLVSCTPIFSPDSRFLLCASGSLINIYSVDSDVCTRTLRYHSADVTSIVINPLNKYQILSSSLDHSIILWDYVDGMILHRYKFHWPINSILSTTKNLTSFYGIVHSSKEQLYRDLVEFSLEKQPTDNKPVAVKVLLQGFPSNSKHFAFGCKATYVAYVKKSKTFTVRNLKTSQTNEIKLEVSATCIAAHPTENILAVGCKTGKIFICRNFLGSVHDVILTTLHWHALDVLCLTFSAQGSYLLSAGYECVLVRWLTDATIRKPETLPRLSAPVVNLSCSTDNQLYAICYIDNGVQLIRSNFVRGHTIQGLVVQHSMDPQLTSIATRLIYDSRSSSVVLNGRTGQLQFFNINSNRQLFNLDIVGHNYISPENLAEPLISTEVENAAFSDDCEWLATVERRDDKLTAVELRFKFWRYSNDKNTFVLNTCIETPHRNKINALKFRPRPSTTDERPLMAVTCSSDGTFKVWSLIDSSDIYKTSVCWSCVSAGFYHNKAATTLDFSDDASVLAVAFDDIVTLWDPDFNTMSSDVISVGNSDTHIRDVVFGRKTCSHFMLFMTDDKLYSWNLLNFSVQWVLAVQVSTIAVNPLTEFCAIFSHDKQLRVLSPSSSTPLYQLTEVSSTDVIDAIFIPNSQPLKDSGALAWQNHSRLYFMSKNQEIRSLYYSDEIEDETTANIKLEQNVPRTVLTMLMAEQTGSGVPAAELVSRNSQLTKTRSNFVDQVLSNPLSGMPPMSVLCLSFIESLLIRKKMTKSSAADSDEEDDTSDDDTVTHSVPATSTAPATTTTAAAAAAAAAAAVAATTDSSDDESLMDTL